MRDCARLKVNYSHFSENIQKIKTLGPKQKIILMVKANAYGHGLESIAQFAASELGIDCFGVASRQEGMVLKNSLKQDKKIFVFSEINLSSSFKTYLDTNLIPVISNKSDFHIALKENLPLVLKFNTGMNRLGLNFSDLEEIILAIKKEGKVIDHLMTHFSSSSLKIKAGDATHRQYQEFLKIKKAFLDAGIEVLEDSVSNSGAIEQKFSLKETHIRPGIMAYGPSSLIKGSHWQGKLIADLECEVLAVFKAKRGTPIGYGGHILSEDSQIAILPLGYGDGLSFHLSGLKLTINDFKTEIIGRVNMDMLALKIPLKSEIKVGETLRLWESFENFSHWCKHLKTIPYEVLCQLSARIPRKYI